MSETLLPCPFCGGEVSIALCGDGFDAWWFITRGHGENACKCRLFMESEKFNKDSEMADFVADDLIAAWNRRAGNDTNVATNADRIRSMSDEELHKLLLDFEAGDVDYAKTFCALCYKDAALERKSTDCEGCLLWWLKNDATLPQGIDWLKQSVKEE